MENKRGERPTKTGAKHLFCCRRRMTARPPHLHLQKCIVALHEPASAPYASSEELSFFFLSPAVGILRGENPV